MDYPCSFCGALSATATCKTCGASYSALAVVLRQMQRGKGQRKYDAPRRRRWWHI